MSDGPSGVRGRVIVVDDDPFVRDMVSGLARDGGLIVVGAAVDGREAIELALHYTPDVVVMDVVMPGMDGVAATARLTAVLPAIRILLLSGADDGELAVAGLRAGATGFIRKNAGPAAIQAAIRSTMAGETVVDADVVGALIARLRAVPEGGVGMRPVVSQLTDREWEVLDGLCADLTVEELAAVFVLSVETVRTHVKSIFRKLGVHSRAQAVEAAAALRRS